METVVIESNNETIMDGPKIKQADAPKKRRYKKKKEKDSNKPKRPPSAYVLWLKDTRDKIKADNPGISFTNIAAKAGQLWKEVEDRTQWETKATKLKEEYFEAMAKFKAGTNEESTSEKVSNLEIVQDGKVMCDLTINEDSNAEGDNCNLTPKQQTKNTKKRKKKKKEY